MKALKLPIADRSYCANITARFPIFLDPKSGKGHGMKVSSETVTETERVIKSRVNKTLSPKTRLAVLSRDLCCQFKDRKTGRQCCSTYALNVDHKTSRWAGGDHSIDNLQVLCFQHNQLKYQRESQIRIV